MKKILICLMLVVICFTLIACNNQSEPESSDSEIPGVRIVADKVMVDEITDSYIVCTMLETRQSVSVPRWPGVDVQSNDIITIYHNGYLLEISPAQFGYVFYIEYTLNGNIVKISNPNSNQIMIPNDNNESKDDSTTSDIPQIDTVSFVRYINDEVYEKQLSLSDAAEIAQCFKNMLDGTSFVCNCMPDYTIILNNVEYYYHSQSGVVFNSADSHNYLVNNKDNVNAILAKYLP